jgi:hypothetical protein
MDLNTFGEKLVAQLSRIANAAETIEAVMKSGKGPAASTGTNTAPATETAAAKKKREAAEALAAAAAAGPKADRPAVNKALVELKDTISKEAAQAVYQKYGYTAMSKIEEKDFDAILADAVAALAAGANVEKEEEEDDL